MPADEYDDEDDRPRKPRSSRDDDDDAPPRRRRDEDDDRDDYDDVPRKRKRPGDGMALASMILGIVAIPFGCCCGLFSLPISITAIILGFVAKGKTGGDGKSTAGIICGFVAIVVAIIMVVIGLMNPNAGVDWQKQFNK